MLLSCVLGFYLKILFRYERTNRIRGRNRMKKKMKNTTRGKNNRFILYENGA